MVSHFAQFNHFASMQAQALHPNGAEPQLHDAASQGRGHQRNNTGRHKAAKKPPAFTNSFAEKLSAYRKNDAADL